LRPRHDEALRVLEELVVVKTRTTLVAQDIEAKLNIWTMQTMEEIVNNEASVVTAVVQAEKESLQRDIEAWKSTTQ